MIEAAFRANLFHGLKASAETRGDYAYWLHITSPEMQQNEIARRVGITQGAVSKAIARRSNNAMKAVQQSEIINDEMRKKQMKNRAVILHVSRRTFLMTLGCLMMGKLERFLILS